MDNPSGPHADATDDMMKSILHKLFARDSNIFPDGAAPPSGDEFARLIEPYIEADWYRESYLGAGQCDEDPVVHFLRHGAVEMHRPNRVFATRWYIENYPEVVATGLNPLMHYVSVGEAAGLNPGPLFDVNWYRRTYLDNDPATSPLRHYLESGARKGVATSPSFDPDFYRSQLGLASALDAFAHGEGTGDTHTIFRSITDLHVERVPDAVKKPICTGFAGKVAVGIVLFNNTSDEVASIVSSARRALQKCLSNGHEIYICDNSAPDRRPRLPPDLLAFTTEKNLGFGAGHNYLMKHAFTDGAAVYVGANPDGTFHPEAIERLVALHDDFGGKALIEAQHLPEEQRKYYCPQSLETAWVSGACFLVPKSLFEDTGGFDEGIFLYCEDVDFSWAAKRRGYKLLHCPRAWFFHDVSARKHEDEAWRREFMLLSGRYIGHKWGSDEFRDWCENELRALSTHTVKDLPDLAHVSRIDDVDHRTDFRHGFAFSPDRG